MSKIEDATTPPSLVEAPAAPASLPSGLVVPGDARRAALMLLLATVAWGFSFVWVKDATSAINAASSLPPGSTFSAALLQSLRFALASLLWMAAFRRSRQGWNRASHRRALILGLLLAAGLVMQTVGLDLTTEAVSAFLTSLGALFVPLIVAVFFGVRPSLVVGLAVALALLGTFLLTGASLTTLGLGEAMGLACAVVFAVHLVLLNRLTRDDSPWRMAAGQFLWVALSMGLLALLTAPSRSAMDFAGFARFEIWGNLLLLVLVPTVFSFGVMFLYQPQVDPTRAAMIYLLEPVFASLIAWTLVGRGLDAVGLAGASMILIANGLAELRTARSRQ